MSNIQLVLVAIISVVYFTGVAHAQCDFMFIKQKVDQQCPEGTDHGDIDDVCTSYRNYIHCFEQAYMGCQIPVTQQLKLQRAINQVDSRCGACGLIPQFGLLMVCVLGYFVSRKHM